MKKRYRDTIEIYKEILEYCSSHQTISNICRSINLANKDALKHTEKLKNAGLMTVNGSFLRTEKGKEAVEQIELTLNYFTDKRGTYGD